MVTSLSGEVEEAGLDFFFGFLRGVGEGGFCLVCCCLHVNDEGWLSGVKKYGAYACVKGCWCDSAFFAGDVAVAFAGG